MTPVVDPQAVAVRVRDARARLGLSQTALASRATVSQATVSRIESADRGVTLFEADRLAQALQLPLDTLLFGSQVGQRVLVAMRVAEAELDRASAIAPGVELLELDERLDSVVADYRQEPRQLPDLPAFTGSPSAAHGARMAASLRAALDLGVGPLTDPAQLIEEVTGVDVATRPLPGVSGMLLIDPQRGTRLILANSDDAAERQRFTLAHELGHLLFGDGAHVDAQVDKAGPAANKVETRCHEFARDLLIPVMGITAWLQRMRSGDITSPVDEQHVGLLARHFGVSAHTVGIQLERAKLVPVGHWPSTPVLASKYGWRQEYQASQAVARQPRPPRRLVQRATVAFAQGDLGARILADLEGRAVDEVEAELAFLQVDVPARKPARIASIDRLLALAGERSPNA